ncbi:hypothetical protein [Embleya sp. NPDC059237]|uniref:hypothetical protein n=1 Tax=Embleya sp. NPDC059237 TaxID=3346784 RepID=UPI003689E5FC
MNTHANAVAHLDSVFLSGQVNDIEHLLLPAVPEFIGALAATLVTAVATRALRKWRRRATSETADDNSPG